MVNSVLSAIMINFTTTQPVSAELPVERQGARQDRRVPAWRWAAGGKGPGGEARGRRGHSAGQPSGVRLRSPRRRARPPGYRGRRGRCQHHPQLHQLQLQPDRCAGSLEDRRGRPAVAGDGAVLVAWAQRSGAQHSQGTPNFAPDQK